MGSANAGFKTSKKLLASLLHLLSFSSSALLSSMLALSSGQSFFPLSSERWSSATPGSIQPAGGLKETDRLLPNDLRKGHGNHTDGPGWAGARPYTKPFIKEDMQVASTHMKKVCYT